MPEKFSSEEIYKKLLEKRTLERKRMAQEKEKKKMAPLFEFFEKVKRESREFELPEEFELEEKERTIEEEISEMVSPKEREEIVKASRERLFNFMKERRKKERLLEQSQQELDKARREIFEIPVAELSEYTYGELSNWERWNETKEEEIEEKLPDQNPESFMAHWLLKLREYKRQLPSGIVETENVRERKERAIDTLLKNRLIALVGETGTGKTRIARTIAEELTGEYEFVAGHKFMTKEDLFAYLGIGIKEMEEMPPEKVPETIKELKKRYYELNPDLPQKEKKEVEKWLEEVIIGRAKTKEKEMVSEIIATGVSKAAQEGRVVIIDEFNYIPPALLAGCNALIESKPGEKINFMGKEIEVKPGFGIIFTGNITKSEFAGRYLREKIDPALVNRLNAGLIEYGSLPQSETLTLSESILEREKIEKGEKPPKRELFLIGLTELVDKKGNLRGPADILEKLWDLASNFSLLQKIYAGEKLETPVKLPTGANYQLEIYHASNRTFRSVIEGWKKEGFKYPIDWYIYDNLIRPCSIIAPSESAQIWTLLKERGGFFRDPEWDRIKIDLSTYKISGIEDIERNRGEIKETLRKGEERKESHFFTPQEIAEAASGKKMPPLPKEKKEERKKEKVEILYRELFQILNDTEKTIDGWEETIKIICEK